MILQGFMGTGDKLTTPPIHNEADMGGTAHQENFHLPSKPHTLLSVVSPTVS